MKWTSLELSKIQKQLYDVSIIKYQTGQFEHQDSRKLMITENIK